MDDRSAQPSEAVHARLSSYFHALRGTFAKATQRAPQTDFHRSLAGHPLRIACAGEALSNAVTSALDHLPPAETGTTQTLDIMAWDEAASGVARPEPPWSWPTAKHFFQYRFPSGGEAFRIYHSEEEAVFYMYALETAQAVMICTDARKLPTYLYASPCFPVIDSWRREVGLHVLHAACVGERGVGVLLVGPGGSGKSTTSLLCAMAGMAFVSDDFCLLRPGPPPEAICLFSAAKLHQHHLRTFPELAAVAVDPVPDREGKPVIFLYEHFRQIVVPRLAIKAILVPRVSGRRDTVVTPTSAAEALKALAPSTLFLKPPFEAKTVRVLADLVRSLPCYRLDLGTATDEIAGKVRTVLELCSA